MLNCVGYVHYFPFSKGNSVNNLNVFLALKIKKKEREREIAATKVIHLVLDGLILSLI